MKVAECSPVPLKSFESIGQDEIYDSANNAQIYKATNSEEEIMTRHHDKTQYDTSLQEEQRTESVQFNEETSEYKPLITRMKK